MKADMILELWRIVKDSHEDTNVDLDDTAYRFLGTFEEHGTELESIATDLYGKDKNLDYALKELVGDYLPEEPEQDKEYVDEYDTYDSEDDEEDERY